MQGGFNGLKVASVDGAEHTPAVRSKTLSHALQEGKVGAPFDLDIIVVVQGYELTKPQGACQTRSLTGHSLLQISIRYESEGGVVHNVEARPVIALTQPSLGHGHTHCMREPLSQRAGGDLDPWSQTELGMPWRFASPLAEVLEFIDGKVVAREVQQGVEQHGGVACGEDKAIAVGPVRVAGIVSQEPIPQDISHRSRSHRSARMPRSSFLNRIHRQKTNRVDAPSIDLSLECHNSSPSRATTERYSERHKKGGHPTSSSHSMH